MNYLDRWTPQLTKDGSFTFFSPEFTEAFHSHYGAKQEAEEKFVIPCQLAQIAGTNLKQKIHLLDICYGLGYNSAAALTAIWQTNPQCQIELIALELNPEVPRQTIASDLLSIWQEPIPLLLKDLSNNHESQTELLQAQLLIGDARQTIQQVIQSGFQADAIFLDPFSPPKAPQLWTVEFLSLVTKCLKSTGKIATYSCAASVRTALILASLHIGASKSIGRRSPGTLASFIKEDLLPLSLQELEHLQTRASIPYRDPNLEDSKEIILARRLQEKECSDLETTSQWKKRWRK